MTTPAAPATSPLRAFGAVLHRDIHVTGRELPSFLAQTLIQPFFFLFIFAVVLTGAGFVADSYGQIILPGLLASLAMVPVGFVLLDDISWPASGLAPAFGMVVLGAPLGGATGLTLGTAVPTRRINVLFSVVFAPLIFTGSVQFPWLALGDLRWFQVICAANPLTYISEGIRAALVPGVAHLPLWLCAVVAAGATAVLCALGVRGFLHRALE